MMKSSILSLFFFMALSGSLAVQAQVVEDQAQTAEVAGQESAEEIKNQIEELSEAYDNSAIKVIVDNASLLSFPSFNFLLEDFLPPLNPSLPGVTSVLGGVTEATSSAMDLVGSAASAPASVVNSLASSLTVDISADDVAAMADLVSDNPEIYAAAATDSATYKSLLIMAAQEAEEKAVTTAKKEAKTLAKKAATTAATVAGAFDVCGAADTEQTKQKITENLQISLDVSTVTQEKFNTVKENQTGAQKELGLTGLTNAWITQTQAARFPNKVKSYSSLLSSSDDEKTLVATLATITLATSEEMNKLVNMMAQSVQSSTSSENTMAGVQVPLSKGAQ